MAKHLNESEYYIEVRALGDGHYMLGNKNIFAKLAGDKLVIKQGGSFMRIEEFIKNYSEGTPMTASTLSQISNNRGRMSPKRAGPGGPASPKRKSITKI